MKMITCAAILGVFIALPGAATAAPQNCGKIQDVAAQLGSIYGEMVFAAGVATNQSVKFLGNPRTGTWTMVAIRPDGIACVIANGDGLEVMNFALARSASYQELQ
jgi:hypothetical protein